MLEARRVWIAYAPPGVWSSGPAVVTDLAGIDTERHLASYRKMGWEVHGPYELVTRDA
jgi:hypothetical protein